MPICSIQMSVLAAGKQQLPAQLHVHALMSNTTPAVQTDNEAVNSQ